MSDDTNPSSSIQIDPTLEAELRTEEANALIRRYTYGALGTGLIPFPAVDLVALIGLQLAQVRSLCKVYGVAFSKNAGKTAIASLVGGMWPATTANAVAASVMKFLPGLGTAVGMASAAILGSGATYAIGKVFQMHFEAGGTVLNFDPDSMRSYFAEQLEEGKKVAASMKQDKDAKKAKAQPEG